MNPEPTPPSSCWNRTAIWLAVLLALHVAFAVVMIVVLPRQKRTFDEFNMQLPSLTLSVIGLGMWYTRVWWLILPVQISATVMGVILGRHGFHRPTPGTVYSFFVLIVLFVALLITVVALALPRIKLLDGLAK